MYRGLSPHKFMPMLGTHATLRFYLEKEGTPIGPNDMLIAAHALFLDLILVTNNVREFSQIPELKIENWLE